MESLRVQRNQKLRITVFTSTAVNISIRGQFSNLPGEELRQIPSDETIIITTAQATRAARNYDYELRNEIIDFFTLQMNTAGVQRGQCFIRASIIYSNTAYVQKILFQDYLTSKGFIGFPYTKIASPTEGNGYIHLLSLGAQAARGNDITYIVPDSCLMKISAIQINYNTSALARNRNVAIYLNTVGGAVVASCYAKYQQPENLNVDYYFSSLFPRQDAVIDNNIGRTTVIESMPNYTVSGDTYDSIVLSALNIDSGATGDLMAYAFARVEEWIKD